MKIWKFYKDSEIISLKRKLTSPNMYMYMFKVHV